MTEMSKVPIRTHDSLSLSTYTFIAIMSSNDDVDAWIAQLMQCKPLSEAEVKKLCDKVGLIKAKLM